MVNEIPVIIFGAILTALMASIGWMLRSRLVRLDCSVDLFKQSVSQALEKIKDDIFKWVLLTKEGDKSIEIRLEEFKTEAHKIFATKKELDIKIHEIDERFDRNY